MYNRFRCTHCDKPIIGKGLCGKCAEEIRKDMEKRELELHPGG